jgi:hypothetical protein
VQGTRRPARLVSGHLLFTAVLRGDSSGQIQLGLAAAAAAVIALAVTLGVRRGVNDILLMSWSTTPMSKRKTIFPSC